MVKTSELRGIEVITSDAFTLGEVTGTDVDTGSWKLTHLHISLSDLATKKLEFKKPLLGSVVICLPVTLVKAFGDVITLQKDIAEVKALPECKRA